MDAYAGAAASQTDHRAKAEALCAVLQRDADSNNLSGVLAFVDYVVSEADRLPNLTLRMALTGFRDAVHLLDPSLVIPVGRHVLSRMAVPLLASGEHMVAVRERMGAILEEGGKLREAAEVFSGLPLEMGQEEVDLYKIQMNIRIATLLLKAGVTDRAELFLSRAGQAVGSVESPAVERSYRFALAILLESKHKFVEAASNYFSLSTSMEHPLHQEDALESAALCAILAGAGPKRSRMLGTLCKDDRCPRLRSTIILQKVYLERLLTAEDARFLASLLDTDRHRAALPALEQSVVEHNLLSARNLYLNITTSELGALLGTTADRAEQTAARMIREERLEASIDQVTGLVTFQRDESALRDWNERVKKVCNGMSAVVETLRARRLCV